MVRRGLMREAEKGAEVAELHGEDVTIALDLAPELERVWGGGRAAVVGLLSSWASLKLSLRANHNQPHRFNAVFLEADKPPGIFFKPQSDVAETVESMKNMQPRPDILDLTSLLKEVTAKAEKGRKERKRLLLFVAGRADEVILAPEEGVLGKEPIIVDVIYLHPRPSYQNHVITNHSVLANLSAEAKGWMEAVCLDDLQPRILETRLGNALIRLLQHSAIRPSGRPVPPLTPVSESECLQASADLDNEEAFPALGAAAPAKAKWGGKPQPTASGPFKAARGPQANPTRRPQAGAKRQPPQEAQTQPPPQHANNASGFAGAPKEVVAMVSHMTRQPSADAEPRPTQAFRDRNGPPVAGANQQGRAQPPQRNRPNGQPQLHRPQPSNDVRNSGFNMRPNNGWSEQHSDSGPDGMGGKFEVLSISEQSQDPRANRSADSISEGPPPGFQPPQSPLTEQQQPFQPPPLHMDEEEERRRRAKEDGHSSATFSYSAAAQKSPASPAPGAAASAPMPPPQPQVCSFCCSPLHHRAQCPEKAKSSGVTCVVCGAIGEHLSGACPQIAGYTCELCGVDGHCRFNCPTHCLHCKETGHYKQKCPKLLERKAGNRGGKFGGPNRGGGFAGPGNRGGGKVRGGRRESEEAKSETQTVSLESSSEQAEVFGAPVDVHCENCGRRGHVEKECLQEGCAFCQDPFHKKGRCKRDKYKTASGELTEEGRRREDAKRAAHKCTVCGGRGHWGRECPSGKSQS